VKNIPGHSVRGLCITGALILAIGAVVVYALQERGSFYTKEENIRLVIMLATVGAGICFIAATARWWMRR